MRKGVIEGLQAPGWPTSVSRYFCFQITGDKPEPLVHAASDRLYPVTASTPATRVPVCIKKGKGRDLYMAETAAGVPGRAGAADSPFFCDCREKVTTGAYGSALLIALIALFAGVVTHELLVLAVLIEYRQRGILDTDGIAESIQDDCCLTLQKLIYLP